MGNGLVPACVTACPNEALRFGDRSDVIAEANNIVATMGPAGKNEFPEANAYGDSSWGSPYDTRVIYVLSKPPSFYGLPT
jgi:formate dehydrogenase iron-sulfur subunit